ncbi:MAG TPA: GntR family transcriptional regulator, partial [Stellaceae bacterium]|nr:GntR family transcriptional regulator [Stellaceae bacterium]
MTPQFNAAVPLYHQIAQVLLMRARSDEATEQRLPTEKALCAEFGVSRTTIRQALGVLKQQRWLQSRRGVGTRFIGAAAKPEPVSSSGDPLHAALGTRARIVELHLAPAPPRVAAFFGVAAGTPLCRLVRVHQLDGAPLSVVASWLPADLASVLTRRALRRPVHHVLWEALGLLQHRSVHNVGIARADQEIARLLEVSLTDPVLHV